MLQTVELFAHPGLRDWRAGGIWIIGICLEFRISCLGFHDLSVIRLIRLHHLFLNLITNFRLKTPNAVVPALVFSLFLRHGHKKSSLSLDDLKAFD